MSEIYMQRRGNYLVPVANPDERAVLELPERRTLVVTANANPPAKLRRWYWAMVALLVEATGRWPTKDAAHFEFMISAGFYESVEISSDGTTKFYPQSVAPWGILEWRAYIDRLLPIIIERYVGETRAQFRDRVNAFVGVKLQEAWQ